MFRVILLVCALLMSERGPWQLLGRVPDTTLYANIYYVSTSGDDSNSCASSKSTTEANQKRHISSGVTCLTPGASLYIHSGNYSDILDTIDNSLTTVPAGASWDSRDVITIRAYPSETVTIAPPDGSNAIKLASGSHNGAIGYSYLIFQDLILDGVNQTTDGADGVHFNAGANHIRLQRLEVKNWVGNGISTSDHNFDTPWSTYFEVLSNIVHNNGRGTGNPLTHGIYIGSSDNLVDGNSSYHNSGFGIQLDNNVNPAWRPASRNIARNNVLYDNGIGSPGSGGLVIAYGSDNQAYNNVIYNNNGSGILVYTNSSNTLVYHNTIYNNSPYAGVNVQYIEGDVLIKNNILYLNLQADVQDDGGSLGGSIIQNHNLSTDPTFVNAGAEDFRVQLGSATIGTGINVGITTDITGYPQPSPPAIGAYVYH